MNNEALQATNTVTVTVDKARQMLHISKRKCAWMLKNGIIPCRVGQKKTRQYTILLNDVLNFASDFTEHPERYPLPPIFSANPNSRMILYSPEPPDNFREWLNDKWYHVPDTLTTADAEKLLGYNRSRINRWTCHNRLNATTVRGETIIAREWLIDFMCNYGWRIAKKSEKHIELLESFNRSENRK